MSADPRRDLALLQQLTARLSERHSLEDALYEVTDAALQLLPADHASVRLFDPSRKLLMASARSGKGTELPPLQLGKGEGIAGWVMEHGLPAHVRDTQADPRFVSAVGQGFSIRSMVAEPLLSAGKPIGVLSVSCGEPDAFKDDDVLLARILANCSVPAIERARIERLATVDELTLAFTGRALAPRLQEEMDRARHSGSSLSLLAVELDSLARVRESFGREIADKVLAVFCERVRAQTRRYDVLVRSAEEEFVVLMPTTNPMQASTCAERLRKTMSDQPVEPQAGGFITQHVSVGVATWNGRESADELRGRAIKAKATAKEQGGDRVVRATPPAES